MSSLNRVSLLGSACLVLALLLAGVRAKADDGRQGLAQAPEGWIFLQEETIDTIGGAYHDKVSGAFVYVEVDPVGILLPVGAGKRPGKVESGEIEGVPYRTELLPPGKRHEGVPKTCDELAVSFLPTNDTSKGPLRATPQARPPKWNFWGISCNEKQNERVKALIFGKAAAVKDGLWTMPADNHPVPKREDVDALAVGTAWEDTRSRLGATAGARHRADGGFVVEYNLKKVRKGEPHLAELTFNAERKLVAKRFITAPG